MSYLSSLGRYLSVFVLLVAGTLGGWLAAKELPQGKLSSTSNGMQLIEPNQSFNELAQAELDALLLAIAAAGGVGLAVYAGRNRSSASSQFHNRLHRPASSSFNQASAHLRRKLLRLLHDDQAAATRLFNYAQMKYPDRSVNWCMEKIIYDLERDRNRAW